MPTITDSRAAPFRLSAVRRQQMRWALLPSTPRSWPGKTLAWGTGPRQLPGRWREESGPAAEPPARPIRDSRRAAGAPPHRRYQGVRDATVRRAGGGDHGPVVGTLPPGARP